MRLHQKIRLAAASGMILALVVGAFAYTALAHPGTPSNAAATRTSAKQGNAVRISDSHVVDFSKLPKEAPGQAVKDPRALPLLYPGGAAAHAQAQHSKGSPSAPHNAGYTPITAGAKAGPAFPSTFDSFNAMADSGAICQYFGGGCQPPDMAVAANPAGGACEAVNTSVACYSNTGGLTVGPVSATALYGVPNPTPAGCQTTGTGPFLSDPRAWFDPFNNRFGFAFLEVEGAGGIDPACTEISKYWIATSTSPNPGGAYHIFSINMLGLGSDATAWADYTQFGFNGDGIYVSGNMFSLAGGFDYAQVVGCGSKLHIYQGLAFACNGWFNFSVGGVLIDTLNPVQNPMSADNSPHAEFLVSSFNSPDPFGNNCFSAVCHGASIWAFSDPGNTTGVGDRMSGAFVDTRPYLEPPGADQPSCPGGGQCVESLDTRVSATPIYHAGHIFAAHSTGITNGAAQFVPGIQWWDFTATLNPGYPTTIAGAAEAQDAYLNASSGFTALTFPVMYPDLDNDIILGYDYMGDAIFPSINFTSRRVTDPANTVSGLGIIAVSGTVSTSNGRWGDYEAMSYTAPYQDFIWLGSEYANPSAGGDWITRLIKLRFNLAG